MFILHEVPGVLEVLVILDLHMSEPQAGKLFSLYYRLDVLGLKVKGTLPQLSWGDVASMMKSSSLQWPAEKLVRLQRTEGDIALFPAGTVRHVVAGAGHFMPREQPHAVVDALLTLLSRT